MLEYTDTYIDKCVDLGILSSTSTHKYPLRPLSLAVVLKVYALLARLPYTLNTTQLKAIEQHHYYLTDQGLAWIYEAFQTWSLEFLRANFANLFLKATPSDLLHLDKFPALANFRGTTGIKPKAGSKQSAMLVRMEGKRKHSYKFESLHEARTEFLKLSRFYPIEQFKLYRLMTNGRYGEVQLTLPPNRRGIIDNLRR